MREILFRGKRTDNNTWVHGSLVTMTNDVSYGNSKVCSNIHIIENGEMDVRCFLRGAETMIDNDVIQIYKESVGQYTGVEDKNGIKIFEGDILKIAIIKDSDDEIEYKFGSVEFSNSLEYIIRSKEGLVCGFGVILNGVGFYEFELEVIGNIYENKDLLK